MPQLRKGHYTWRTCAHMVVSLFDVGHVSKRHLGFDHLLAFCGFWLVSSVSIRHARLSSGSRGSLAWSTCSIRWMANVVFPSSLLVRSSTQLTIQTPSHTRRTCLATRGSLSPLRGLAHVANVLHVVFCRPASGADSEGGKAASSCTPSTDVRRPLCVTCRVMRPRLVPPPPRPSVAVDCARAFHFTLRKSGPRAVFE